MDRLEVITNPIKPEFEHLRELLSENLTHPAPMLSIILQSVVRHRGKQMRPILMLLSSKLFNGVSDSTYKCAVAIELFHTATLIHDDVVDNSDQRRGQSSVNYLYNNNVAVLVGDYLLGKVLQNISETNSTEIMYILSQTSQELAAGELLQLDNTLLNDFSEKYYMDVIHNKTASLFSSSARVGALTGGASAEDVEKLARFGELLGLSFQIRDDIFDYYPSSEVGKPTGNDMREGKLTLPILYALNKTKDQHYLSIAKSIRVGMSSDDDIAELTSFAIKEGGIDYAYSTIEKMISEAKNILTNYKDSEIRRSLEAYADYVLERKH